MTVEYKVISGSSYELEREVQDYLASGYSPVGGVSIAVVGCGEDGYSETFAQALVRYGGETTKEDL